MVSMSNSDAESLPIKEKPAHGRVSCFKNEYMEITTTMPSTINVGTQPYIQRTVSNPLVFASLGIFRIHQIQ